jgi:hypothetical protein
MKVYIVVDDGPADDWGFEILKAFTTKKKASEYIKACKIVDAYSCQYFKVKIMDVE